MRKLLVVLSLITLTSCGAMSGLLKSPAAMELLVDSEKLLESELEQKEM